MVDPPPVAPPVSRRLRVLAFDPSLAIRLETAPINEITLQVPWENDLKLGPVGEYLEVVDFDPASKVFYYPVDLNDPNLLAQDGLPPSELNPQFHQQMVYAVAMTTIRQFERALGRVAFWSDHKAKRSNGDMIVQFVRQLRLYPHALRERNAYYSPSKKAILFGYFPVNIKDAHNTPGSLVFSCLSHDIIVHETTHALLDGVHPRFNEPTNPDVQAFHEAFADIIALFQHFTYQEVLINQIRQTRGTLQSENLLSQLAQQFGRATGRGSALRDALGHTNKKTGQWEPTPPDPRALESTLEPHARGAILVAAVFRAFLLIYRARTADLFRIASNGTGILPEGEPHPDLARRLAQEAAQSADRVLQMCIRSIDYCPPVDITFGDFLRGVITADLDYNPADEGGYRTVFIQSFREWGIHPRGIISMGPDALAWPTGEELLRNLRATQRFVHSSSELRKDMRNNFLSMATGWSLESDRHEVWKKQDALARQLWSWLRGGDSYGRDYAKLFGLIIQDVDAPKTVFRDRYNEPSVEIHSARPAIRRTAQGTVHTDLVVEVTQRRRGYFDPDVQKKKDKAGLDPGEQSDFLYRAGCTILIDTATQEVRRVIRTPGTIADDAELERVRRYLTGEAGVTGNAFDAGLVNSYRLYGAAVREEPFALLHQQKEG